MGKLSKQTTSVWKASKLPSQSKPFRASVAEYFKPDKLGFSVIAIDFLILLLVFIVCHIFVLSVVKIDIGNYSFQLFSNFSIEPLKTFEETNQLQNIFALHAAITALIFPIVFFIAEKLRSSEKDEGRVLMRESSFWHIVFFGTGLFLNLAICGNYIFREAIYIVHTFYILLVLNSIRSIINVLLSPLEMNKRTESLYLKRMDQYNHDLISLRIANNNLVGYLNEGEHTKYSLFSEEDKKTTSLNSKQFGVIADVNLKELNKLTNKVLKLLASSQRAPEVSSESSEVVAGNVKKESLCIKINKLIGMRISQENPQLINITGIAGIEKKELESYLSKIFTIQDSKSFEEELDIELETIRDDLIQNIRLNNTSRVETRIEQLVAVSKSFLDMLKSINSNYNAQEASKERGSLFLRWNQIEFVTDILDDALQESLLTNNTKIIRQVIYLPIKLSSIAINYNDHYIFQSFIGNIARVYHLSQTMDINRSTEEFIFDRSYRYLSELANYTLVPHVEKTTNQEDITNYDDYFQLIFKVFMNLSREAYRLNKLNHFSMFIKKLDKIGEHFEYNSYRHEDLDVLSNARLDFKDKIENYKQEIYFGLSAFILKDMLSTSDKDLNAYLKVLYSYLKTDIKDFSEVFIRVHNHDKGDQWGWDWWSFSSDEEGEVRQVDTMTNFEKFFAIRGSQLLDGKSQEVINSIDMPTNRDLYFLAEGTSSLLNYLNSLKADNIQVGKLFDGISTENIDKLILLLNKAKEKQLKLDEETVISSQISEEKKQEFIKDFIEGYKRSNILYTIFQSERKITNKTSTYVKKPDARGINQIESKEGFIEDWHVHYVEFGEHFGSNMAFFQNQKIFDSLYKKAVSIDAEGLNHIKINVKEFLTIISGVNIYQLKQLFASSTTIKITSLWEDHDDPDKQVEKLPYKEHVDGFISFQNIRIPILTVNTKTKTPTVLITKTSSLGKIVQYKPLNTVNKIDLIDGKFSLEIIDLAQNTETRNELLAKNPDWLSSQTDKETYLKQRVIIKIFEKLQYMESGKEELYKLEVK